MTAQDDEGAARGAAANAGRISHDESLANLTDGGTRKQAQGGAASDHAGIFAFRSALSEGKVLVFNLDEMATIDATGSAGGTQYEDGQIGLHGFERSLKDGQVLVFNLKDQHALDVASPSVQKTQKQEFYAELPGYQSAIEEGKVLVFNVNEMDALDLCKH